RRLRRCHTTRGKGHHGHEKCDQAMAHRVLSIHRCIWPSDKVLGSWPKECNYALDRAGRTGSVKHVSIKLNNRSEEFAPYHVEYLNLSRGCWTCRVLVGQQRPDHGIPRRAIRGPEPLPQRRLMVEAKLTRHRGAPEVVGVAVDLDSRHVLNDKGHFGKRRS